MTRNTMENTETVACGVCLKEIPKSVAHSLEGEDYVYHFCGAEEPMLLAWSDRRRNEVSPDIPECQHQPGWLAYAESHGGNLKVEINRGEYVFVFRAE